MSRRSFRIQLKRRGAAVLLMMSLKLKLRGRDEQEYRTHYMWTQEQWAAMPLRRKLSAVRDQKRKMIGTPI